MTTPATPRCANCGCAVTGKFCGDCGQRNAPRMVSVRRMLSEVLDDQLTLNSALPRTLRGLLLHPGFLTREYVAGRIVRYVAPFRLYLAASLGFFLALALVANPERLGEQVDRGIRRGESRDGSVSVEPGLRTSKVIRFGVWLDTTRVPEWRKPLARHLARQEDRLNGMSKGQIVNVLVAGLERNAPKAIFLLLPAFALFLKLLYLRRDRLYVEHFVFALHLHAFAFLLFTVMLVTRSPGLSAALLLWLLAYVFVAMRRVYGQGVLRTAGKYVLLGWAYFFALVFGLVATLFVVTLTA
jgi:hypothetical protein